MLHKKQWILRIFTSKGWLILQIIAVTLITILIEIHFRENKKIEAS